jgi:5S rRNA maturation endonuclease (ribonuclease M5)
MLDNTADELARWIGRLTAEQPHVIVEGKKDEAALRALGLTHITTLNKPLFEVVEDVARVSKSVVILTDLDSQGKELFGILNEGLQRNGVKVDTAFRRFLLRNTPLRHIEGIATFVANAQS